LATTIFNLFTDYRGVAWCIGGDSNVRSVITTANILREYSSDAHGHSTGKGDINSAGARFNVAVTGGVVQDIPSQMSNLISRMKSSTSINFQNDWKVVTIMVGANNLCDYCIDPNLNSPTQFQLNIEQGLDMLLKDVPHVFVNLVSTVDVTSLYPASTGFCGLLHGFECECGVHSDPNVRKTVSEIALQYNSRLHDISLNPKYNTDDFAVVYQPFLSQTVIPTKPDGKPDLTYLAPDCFHFSEKSHQAAGVGLWNNMLQAPGDKSVAFTPGEQITCPNEHSLIRTNRN